MRRRLYRAIAGVHGCGPLTVIIHDDGVTVAWRGIVKAEWYCRLWQTKDTP